MEMEATGAPQNHHHTLNQQVGSITHYLFDITVLISKIKRRLTRVPAVKGRLSPRPRKHSRFSALRQRATRARVDRGPRVP